MFCRDDDGRVKQFQDQEWSIKKLSLTSIYYYE